MKVSEAAARRIEELCKERGITVHGLDITLAQFFDSEIFLNLEQEIE